MPSLNIIDVFDEKDLKRLQSIENISLISLTEIEYFLDENIFDATKLDQSRIAMNLANYRYFLFCFCIGFTVIASILIIFYLNVKDLKLRSFTSVL
ncbi:hypothetical protein NH340_JMT03542 [Sarcoptes scabiei]|nr:hypothetical protein NH340_JMT03542 [Sarcoptes scabiei]